VSAPQARRADTAPVVDHAAVLARAERILVTAHPAEPLASVALRAGEGALDSFLAKPDGILADGLRELLARHLRERLPDDDAGQLHAAVTAAAVVAALDLAVARWLAEGAHADAAAACRARFRAVAALLPPDPGCA
jgi:hypothetical protein